LILRLCYFLNIKIQNFSFEEPLKYIVSKANANTDTVDIQLPLELNHPVSELVWVFRRKAVRVNNEWANFTPSIGLESTPDRFVPAGASIRDRADRGEIGLGTDLTS
jgi:hypothetical protein